MTRWHVYILEPDGDTSVYICHQEPVFGSHATIIFYPKNGAYPEQKHIIAFARVSRIVENRT